MYNKQPQLCFWLFFFSAKDWNIYANQATHTNICMYIHAYVCMYIYLLFRVFVDFDLFLLLRKRKKNAIGECKQSSPITESSSDIHFVWVSKKNRTCLTAMLKLPTACQRCLLGKIFIYSLFILFLPLSQCLFCFVFRNVWWHFMERRRPPFTWFRVKMYERVHTDAATSRKKGTAVSLFDNALSLWERANTRRLTSGWTVTNMAASRVPTPYSSFIVPIRGFIVQSHT